MSFGALINTISLTSLVLFGLWIIAHGVQMVRLLFITRAYQQHNKNYFVIPFVPLVTRLFHDVAVPQYLASEAIQRGEVPVVTPSKSREACCIGASAADPAIQSGRRTIAPSSSGLLKKNSAFTSSSSRGSVLWESADVEVQVGQSKEMLVSHGGSGANENGSDMQEVANGRRHNDKGRTASIISELSPSSCPARWALELEGQYLVLGLHLPVELLPPSSLTPSMARTSERGSNVVENSTPNASSVARQPAVNLKLKRYNLAPAVDADGPAPEPLADVALDKSRNRYADASALLRQGRRTTHGSQRDAKQDLSVARVSARAGASALPSFSQGPSSLPASASRGWDVAAPRMRKTALELDFEAVKYGYTQYYQRLLEVAVAEQTALAHLTQHDRMTAKRAQRIAAMLMQYLQYTHFEEDSDTDERDEVGPLGNPGANLTVMEELHSLLPKKESKAPERERGGDGAGEVMHRSDPAASKFESHQNDGITFTGGRRARSAVRGSALLTCSHVGWVPVLGDSRTPNIAGGVARGGRNKPKLAVHSTATSQATPPCQSALPTLSSSAQPENVLSSSAPFPSSPHHSAAPPPTLSFETRGGGLKRHRRGEEQLQISDSAIASLEALVERVWVAQMLQPRYQSLLFTAHFSAVRAAVRRGTTEPPIWPQLHLTAVPRAVIGRRNTAQTAPGAKNDVGRRNSSSCEDSATSPTFQHSSAQRLIETRLGSVASSITSRSKGYGNTQPLEAPAFASTGPSAMPSEGHSLSLLQTSTSKTPLQSGTELENGISDIDQTCDNGNSRHQLGLPWMTPASRRAPSSVKPLDPKEITVSLSGMSEASLSRTPSAVPSAGEHRDALSMGLVASGRVRGATTAAVEFLRASHLRENNQRVALVSAMDSAVATSSRGSFQASLLPPRGVCESSGCSDATTSPCNGLRCPHESSNFDRSAAPNASAAVLLPSPLDWVSSRKGQPACSPPTPTSPPFAGDQSQPLQHTSCESTTEPAIESSLRPKGFPARVAPAAPSPAKSPYSSDMRIVYVVGADRPTLLRSLTLDATRSFEAGACNFMCFFTSEDEQRARRCHMVRLARQSRAEERRVARQERAIEEEVLRRKKHIQHGRRRGSLREQHRAVDESTAKLQIATSSLPPARGQSWHGVRQISDGSFGSFVGDDGCVTEPSSSAVLAHSGHTRCREVTGVIDRAARTSPITAASFSKDGHSTVTTHPSFPREDSFHSMPSETDVLSGTSRAATHGPLPKDDSSDVPLIPTERRAKPRRDSFQSLLFMTAPSHSSTSTTPRGSGSSSPTDSPSEAVWTNQPSDGRVEKARHGTHHDPTACAPKSDAEMTPEQTVPPKRLLPTISSMEPEEAPRSAAFEGLSGRTMSVVGTANVLEDDAGGVASPSDGRDEAERSPLGAAETPSSPPGALAGGHGGKTSTVSVAAMISSATPPVVHSSERHIGDGDASISIAEVPSIGLPQTSAVISSPESVDGNHRTSDRTSRLSSVATSALAAAAPPKTFAASLPVYPSILHPLTDPVADDDVRQYRATAGVTLPEQVYLLRDACANEQQVSSHELVKPSSGARSTAVPPTSKKIATHLSDSGFTAVTGLTSQFSTRAALPSSPPRSFTSSNRPSREGAAARVLEGQIEVAELSLRVLSRQIAGYVPLRLPPALSSDDEDTDRSNGAYSFYSRSKSSSLTFEGEDAFQAGGEGRRHWNDTFSDRRGPEHVTHCSQHRGREHAMVGTAPSRYRSPPIPLDAGRARRRHSSSSQRKKTKKDGDRRPWRHSESTPVREDFALHTHRRHRGHFSEDRKVRYGKGIRQRPKAFRRSNDIPLAFGVLFFTTQPTLPLAMVQQPHLRAEEKSGQHLVPGWAIGSSKTNCGVAKRVQFTEGRRSFSAAPHEFSRQDETHAPPCVCVTLIYTAAAEQVVHSLLQARRLAASTRKKNPRSLQASMTHIAYPSDKLSNTESRFLNESWDWATRTSMNARAPTCTFDNRELESLIGCSEASSFASLLASAASLKPGSERDCPPNASMVSTAPPTRCGSLSSSQLEESEQLKHSSTLQHARKVSGENVSASSTSAARVLRASPPLDAVASAMTAARCCMEAETEERVSKRNREPSAPYRRGDDDGNAAAKLAVEKLTMPAPERPPSMVLTTEQSDSFTSSVDMTETDGGSGGHYPKRATRLNFSNGSSLVDGAARALRVHLTEDKVSRAHRTGIVDSDDDQCATALSISSEAAHGEWQEKRRVATDELLNELRNSDHYPDGVPVGVNLTYVRIGDDLYAITEVVDRTFIQYREERAMQPYSPSEASGKDDADDESLSILNDSGSGFGSCEDSEDVQASPSDKPFHSLDAALQAMQNQHKNTARQQRRRLHQRIRAASMSNFGGLSYSLSGSAPLRPGMRRQEVHMCWRCLSAEASIIFIPCGHFAVCENCAELLADCCVCHAPILSSVALL